MRSLIINADDFALTESCSRGIIKAFTHGVISGATVLATVDGLPRAAQWARAARLPLGLHLCLTCGRPAADQDKIAPLLDKHGFLKSIDVIRRDPPPAEAVAMEWQAQLDRLRAVGISPDHLDSHHYVHECLGPDIAEAALRLAQKAGVPLRHTTADSKNYYRQNGVITPDSFTREFYGAQATVGRLLEILSEPWEGVRELMCHPGEEDAAIHGASSYNRERRQELAVLLSPQIREALRGRDIRLISFADI